jgi:hypothetical protein
MLSHYRRQCQEIIEDYRAAGGAWPAKKGEIADWALSNKRWKPSREDIHHMCAQAMVETMQEEEFTDPTTGLTVRAKVPAKTTRDGEQGTFWADVRDATPEFMQISVQQWRKGIVNSCYTWSKVTRVFNAHHEEVEHIQLVLDFSRDVRELDQPKSANVAEGTSSSNEERLRRSERSRPILADSEEEPDRSPLHPLHLSHRPVGPRRRDEGSVLGDATPQFERR